MYNVHEFLTAIAIVLCVAAITTVVFQWLRQPVVLGYIIAGLIVGPHVPIPLVADSNIVTTLSELGVILLMFSLGLEFSLRKLLKVGSTASIIAVFQSSVMVWLGFSFGRLFGWTTIESLFTGAIIAISSTTIIAKVFDEQKIYGKLREIVVGVLIVEDLIGIVFMAMLTGIVSGSGLEPLPLAMTVGKLAAFLVGLLGIGLFIVPRVMKKITKLDRKETTLVASIGFCFAISLLANEFGYSVALGAFLAGSLIAESGEEKQVEHLIEPVRDMFAAIFFVSVGMSINPAIILQYLPIIIILTLIVIVGKFFAVSVGTFLTGNGLRTSIQTGMSMAQIGEFSFIIAALGISLKATGEFLYPIAVAISALTTLSTPLLIRNSVPFTNFIDRKLPKPLQTFTALYAGWIESLRPVFEKKRKTNPVRRLFYLLIIDAVFLAGIIIGTALIIESSIPLIQKYLQLTETVIKITIVILSSILCVPFCIGIVRLGRKLGTFLAQMALPNKKEGRVDIVAAPRRMLIVTLQLGTIFLVGIPLFAITQPFLPTIPTISIFIIITIILSIIFWRSAANLQGHVRAGVEVITQALNFQSRKSTTLQKNEKISLNEIHQLIPGFGDIIEINLAAGSFAIEKTLANLNLRGVTEATVLAITRNSQSIIPTAHELLKENDILILSGTHEAVKSAKNFLSTGKISA